MKRLTAWLLITVMVITMTETVYANDQDPVESFTVDDVSYQLTTDYVTGDEVINPTMTVSWEDPDTWNQEDDYHEPDYYDLTVSNLTMDTEEEMQFYDGSDEYSAKTVDLHNEMTLETGSLYEMSIFPYHDHVTYDDDGNATYTAATQSDGPLYAYAITDVATEYVSGSEEIQVIWEDIGVSSFEYRIAYALGEYDTLDDLLDNAEGTVIVTSASDGVEAYVDAEAGRDMLTYTVDNNIIPGQSYSIMVECIADEYNGNSLYRNRYYPNISNVATSVELFLEEEGADQIRLTWEIPVSYQIDGNTSTLSELSIIEYEEGSPSTIAVFNDDAGSIGYYILSKPDSERSYQLEVSYSNQSDSTYSNTVTYSPSDYLIQPTVPVVPSLLTEEILETLLADYSDSDDIEDNNDSIDLLEGDYLVPDYDYNGLAEDVMAEDITFHIEDEGGFNFVWGAFERLDVDSSSDDYGELIYDNDVYYDIYVTDDYDALSYMDPTYEDIIHTSSSDEDALVLEGSDDDDEDIVVGYRQYLDEYYRAATESTAGEETDILAGNLYYISIKAKKVTGSGTLVSDAYTVAVYYGYDGDAYEPPAISKPPFQLKDDETTEESITVIWKESWYEIMSDEAPDGHILSDWQQELWMDDDGTLSTEEESDYEHYLIYEGEYLGIDQIEKFTEDYAEIEPTYTISEREINLSSDDENSDVEYKFVYYKYEDVLDTISDRQEDDDYSSDYDIEDYIEDLMNGDTEGYASISWDYIDPETDEDDDDYLSYTQDGLFENTSYLFMLLPYRTLEDGEVLSAHYPATLIVSTEPEETTVDPDPTVPYLYADALTDSEIEVQWKYNLDFDYELVYSMEDDVDTAESVDISLPDEDDEDYPTDGDYYTVTVDDLFPLTTYYFWLQATEPDTGSESDWSNPASDMTKDVSAPVPPRGLGILPDAYAEDYGYDESVTDDYIIVEWIYDLNDEDAEESDEEEEETNVTKTYTYIIEFSENANFIDPVYVESSGGTNDVIPDTVELLEKNIVKFNDLIGNRYYYVRAKTQLVVEGSEDDQYLEKESESYTSPIRILTSGTGDEYDGTIDPALEILPDEDYELIYDKDTDMLEFRFRSSEEDEDGASDNSVDQRLISELIQEKSTTYEVDLTSYKSKDIDQRRITMPYSIVEAFDDYGIELIVLTEHVNLNIPHDSLVGEVYDQVNRFGVAPTVIIDITDMSSSDVYDQLTDSGLQSIATPQEIKVTVTSDSDSGQVYYSDEMIEVEIPVMDWYGISEDEVVAFTEDSRGNWGAEDSDYNDKTHTVSFETAKLGGMGAFVYHRGETINGSNADPDHWSETYRREVYSDFTILGNDTYDPEAAVSEKAVAQAVYGTITGSTVIDFDQSMTSAQIQTMIRAGLTDDASVTSGTISRQSAISMFARAYEIVDGDTVDVSDSTLEAVEAVSGVDSSYTENLAKAVEAGLISSASDLRPTDDLAYGELFTLWSRLLD